MLYLGKKVYFRGYRKIAWILVFLIYLFMCSGTIAQTNTYKGVFFLETANALGLAENVGFGALSNGVGSGTIRVEIHNKIFYDQKVSNTLIYGFEASKNTNGSYENTAYGFGDGRIDYWPNLRSIFLQSGDPGYVYDLYSNDLPALRAAIGSEIKYRSTIIPSSGADGLDLVSQMAFEVLVKISGTGGAELTDIESIRLPGLGIITQADLKLAELRYILENPVEFPNYIMLAAHRGYWKYAPENSIEAFINAAEAGADMVEIDVRMTADNQVIVMKDDHLGRLTTIPSALQDANFQEGSNYLFDKMRLCDIRPDLCPGNPEFLPDNPNNCLTCSATNGVNNSDPVRLKRLNGEVTEVLPSLREAFDVLKQYPILIDLDKVRKGNEQPDFRFPSAPIQVITYFLDSLYNIADEKDLLDRIVVKQRLNAFTLAELKSSRVVDWSRWYYTPTIFPDTPPDDCGGDFQTCLNGFFDDPYIKSPGVELIYLAEADEVLPVVFTHVREVKQKRVIQFPSYPENGAGTWNNRELNFTDIDPRFDRRNDWNWLLQEVRRPDVIISDRFEILYDLLVQLGLRDKG